MKEDSLYRNRPLVGGYPGREQRYVELKKRHLAERQSADAARGGLNDIITCFERLTGTSGAARPVAVIGCGPSPHTVAQLLAQGYDAVGVEPVEGSLSAAQRFLNDATRVKRGTAEALPFPDGSQAFVLMESVLEHVDSPVLSLAEIYRVLAPGGVLFVRTTNRFRVSPRGRNWEFRVPFYNWLPRIVKESYVFLQLHYRPELADYSPRPAVHWFSFADLCALGRQVGFAQFYAPSDLLTMDMGEGRPSWRRRVMNRLRRQPWLRAANLTFTQMGGDIYLWKRT
jgi:SAM-dependent methyltransferase